MTRPRYCGVIGVVVVLLCVANVCRSLEILGSGGSLNTDNETCTCLYQLRNLVDESMNASVPMGPICLNSSKTRMQLLSCAQSSVEICDPNKTVHDEILRDLDRVCKQGCEAYLTLESELKTCWEKLATVNEAYLSEKFESFCNLWTESQTCTNALATRCSDAMLQMVLNRTVTKDRVYARLQDTATTLCDPACTEYLQNYTKCQDFVATLGGDITHRQSYCSSRHDKCVFSLAESCSGLDREVNAELLIKDLSDFNSECLLLEMMTTEDLRTTLSSVTPEIQGSSEMLVENEATLISLNVTGKAFVDTINQTRNETKLEPIEVFPLTTDTSATSSEQFTSGLPERNFTSSRVPEDTTTARSDQFTSGLPERNFTSSRVPDDTTTARSMSTIPSVKVDVSNHDDGWVPCNKMESKAGESRGSASSAASFLVTRLCTMVGASILIATGDRFLG